MAAAALATDDAARVTVTITGDQDRQLKAMAARSKVSVAWLVRHAIDQLLARDTSLDPTAAAENQR